MNPEALLSAAHALVSQLQSTPGASLDAANALLELLESSDIVSQAVDPTKYFTLLTLTGASEFISAKAENRAVLFNYLALDDGGGSPVNPSELMQGPVNEVHRVAITSITPDEQNPSWLRVEAVVPSDVGGWDIRGVALLGGGLPTDSKCLAVGNFPATYKPLLSQGATKDLIIRMIIQVGNASVVNLTVDPSVALATNQAIINSMHAHLLEVNPHPQYALLADLIQHLMALDPHPQYAKAADLGAHRAAPDPHPQYISADELDAALSGVIAATKPNLALLHFRTTM